MADQSGFTSDGTRPEQFRDVESALDAKSVTREILSGHGSELVSPETGWKPAETTCDWAKKVLEQWDTDSPKKASRHGWLQYNAVRLACMRRYGCLTSGDELVGQLALMARFRWLLANTGEPREPHESEVMDCLKWGIETVQNKTDEEVLAELAEHTHTVMDSVTEAMLDRWTSKGKKPPDGGQPPKLVLADIDWEGMTNAVWAWESRWAIGELALIGGYPGTGKSLINHYAVGALTRGELPGNYLGRAEDVRVLIVSTEEHEQHVLGPHLLSAGVVREKVKTIKWAGKPGTAIFKIQDNWTELEAVLRNYKPTVLILDPIASKISKEGDSNKDADVRAAIEPLLDLAREIGMAVVGVMHFNKAGNDHLLYAFSGSTAWGAICRTASVVVPDENSGTFTLGQVKNSLARKLAGVYPYTINESLVANPVTGEEITSAAIEWLQTEEGSQKDIETVAANYKRRNDKKHDKQDEMVQAKRDISTVLIEYIKQEPDQELLWTDARQLLVMEKLLDKSPNEDTKSKAFKQWDNNALRKVKRAIDSEKRLTWGKTAQMPSRSVLKFQEDLLNSL